MSIPCWRSDAITSVALSTPLDSMLLPKWDAPALAGRSALCELALDLFISLYGAEAGNLALTMKATGGLFVGGGIAPKLIEKLNGSTRFMDAFTAKGRMRSLLEAIPVRVILNDRTALLGAAFWSAHQ
jgi:glucokinase